MHSLTLFTIFPFFSQLFFTISKNKNLKTLVIHGGKNVALLFYSFDQHAPVPCIKISHIIHLGSFGDFIVHAKFFEEDSKQYLIIGFAHNFVEVFQLSFADANSTSITLTRCHFAKGEPNCLVYGMSIFGTRLNNLVAVCGTIMSHVRVNFHFVYISACLFLDFHLVTVPSSFQSETRRLQSRRAETV